MLLCSKQAPTTCTAKSDPTLDSDVFPRSVCQTGTEIPKTDVKGIPIHEATNQNVPIP